VLTLLSTLTLGLSVGDRRGDHARIRAGIQYGAPISPQRCCEVGSDPLRV
jgi:hypothetical protein